MSAEIDQVVAERNSLREQIRATINAQCEALKPLQEAIDACSAYIISQAEALTDLQLMALKFAAAEEAALIAGRMKPALDAISNEEKACEAAIQARMIKNGTQQVKTAAGETHFTTLASVTVQDMNTAIGYMLNSVPPLQTPLTTPEDWIGVLAHVQRHGLWGLLENRLRKTEVKELLESGVSPDALGVKYDAIKKLAWRKS